MPVPPNELYSAFSFIGFVLCVIPFYWHFKARNTGTCLFMFWTGLGCLLQCINSIVWNKDMINRAPVYCDISTRIQVALTAAVPASSLCINRLLYRVARMKSAGTTDAENRRIVIVDLLIGVGIPVLQIVSQYIVSPNRYNIFEDIGPYVSYLNTLPAIFLCFAWPVAIGTVSFFYCDRTICSYYLVIMVCQYLRLMAISATDILGSVPLGTYSLVFNAKLGIVPWKGWASVHSHYSGVGQVAGFVWKNDPKMVVSLEMFRWTLVACAFIFFALFGFTDEAREQYYRLYKLLARRISTSSPPPHGAQHVTPSVPYVKRNGGVTNPTMVQTGPNRDNSSVSLTLIDQLSVLSISIESTHISDSTAVQDSHSDVVSFYTAKSFDEPGMQDECQSAPPAGIPSTVRPASVPPHSSGASESTMPVHASSSVETV